MHLKEIDYLKSGVEPIRPPTPHKFKTDADSPRFRPKEDSKQDHHRKAWVAWLAGANVGARRP